MNLLDKLTYLIKPGLAILLIPFFFACDDPSELGLELEVDEDIIETEKLEFTLPASSILIDSLRTDHFSYNVAGQYADSVYGSVRAEAYNQYDIRSGTLPTGDTIAFSHAIMVLKVRDIKAPDLLQDERFTIHEVNDTLYSQPAYLADRKLDYDPNPVGDLSFDFDPEEDSVIQILLTEEFGRFLYDRLNNASEQGPGRDSLLQSLFHYPPLAIVPGVDNQGLFSFDLDDDTTGIYINMTSQSGDDYSWIFDFEGAHFTHVGRNRSGGKLSDITTEYEESTTPSSRVYMSMLHGIYPKLDLAPLIEHIKSNDQFMVNRATMSLGAAPPPGLGHINNVASLRSYFIKENGEINGAGINLGDGFSNAILGEQDYLSSSNSSNVLTIGYNETDATYDFDVTLFTQIFAEDYSVREEFLTEELVLVSPETLGLGQTSFKKSELKLTLYITSLKE